MRQQEHLPLSADLLQVLYQAPCSRSIEGQSVDEDDPVGFGTGGEGRPARQCTHLLRHPLAPGVRLRGKRHPTPLPLRGTRGSLACTPGALLAPGLAASTCHGGTVLCGGGPLSLIREVGLHDGVKDGLVDDSPEQGRRQFTGLPLLPVRLVIACLGHVPTSR